MDDGNSAYDPELGDWQTLITVFSPTEARNGPSAVADSSLHCRRCVSGNGATPS